MKLKYGTRFLLLSRGEMWEVHKRTLMGGLLCKIVAPLCRHHDCPTHLYQEFSDAEVMENNVVLDLSGHQGEWLGQSEVEIVAVLKSRLKELTSQQRRSLLLAVRGHIDRMLSQ